jgi:methylaspartate mutase epsilon subunit
MIDLLVGLERQVGPDVLTVTIDSHTRLLQFDAARRALDRYPERLNGYPPVSHGWRRGRELNEAVRTPLQVRHGSPDARLLFDVAVPAGITSFEGGGIGCNLPYAKDVPIRDSLEAWRQVDWLAGELTTRGIDRELFGTLTAALMPPSVCLALMVLEAIQAATEGVRCISMAYPQGGHLWQDVAALRAIPRLAARYLPDASVVVHPVLHAFMGVFPGHRDRAKARRGNAEGSTRPGAIDTTRRYGSAGASVAITPDLRVTGVHLQTRCYRRESSCIAGASPAFIAGPAAARRGP